MPNTEYTAVHCSVLFCGLAYCRQRYTIGKSCCFITYYIQWLYSDGCFWLLDCILPSTVQWKPFIHYSNDGSHRSAFDLTTNQWYAPEAKNCFKKEKPKRILLFRSLLCSVLNTNNYCISKQQKMTRDIVLSFFFSFK